MCGGTKILVLAVEVVAWGQVHVRGQQEEIAPDSCCKALATFVAACVGVEWSGVGWGGRSVCTWL